MINAIVDFSVKHKWAILLSVLIGSIAGYWSLSTMRLDAIPDLGETQVIVYSRWDRSPEIIESQVTYPIVTSMTGAPHVKTVRGVSDFGYSFVYVIFDDTTDLYWARSRVLEYLSGVRAQLPEGVKTEIGPDASSLGWIYQYALVDTSGKRSLADLRSLQDWHLRYLLKSVPGVAEVAPIGGFERQYQVALDPDRLKTLRVTLRQVVDAVRGGNSEASGRMLEFGGTEYMVRGRGYAKSTEDFENIVVTKSLDGAPILVKNLGKVSIGPDMRRGISDLNGRGEVVSGIVIMRSGENALEVTDRIKAKILEIEPSLPQGVRVVPIYDRSTLVRQTVRNTEFTILEVVATVALIILIFLWHFPSAIIPLITMPTAVLISFIALRMTGITINVMSLAGLAIAFGELIDASIVVVEQTHKRLEEWQRNGSFGMQRDVVLSAVKEVAGPTFFALLVIAVSFLPVLMLEAEEGRMFRPLAYAKTMAMLAAALLAITLDPALRILLTKTERFYFKPSWLAKLSNLVLDGKIRSENQNPVSRALMHIYEPVVRWTLRRKYLVLGGAVLLILSAIPAYLSLGSEFIPPMEENAILYMPSTAPGISIGQAQVVLQATDAILKNFPEVDSVMGKAGRAETPTDPAPLSMLETLITLKPRDQWRHIETWYSAWSPGWLRPVFYRLTPDTISNEQLVSEMNDALKVPGMTNAWTMPIQGRIQMLTSGIRTPLGIKVSGADSVSIQAIGTSLEALLPTIRGARAVFAERTGQGHFIDIEWKREELARFGISLDEAQEAVNGAIGGDNVTTVFNGPERYPVSVRYMRDFRSDLDALGRVLVAVNGDRQIPISQLASLRVRAGPAMIRDENGLQTGYVYIDLAERDPGSYIDEAKKVLKEKLILPPGYVLSWSGQFEAMHRGNMKLMVAVPVTIFIVILLIFINTKSAIKTMIILAAVPFSAIGAVWLLYFLHYNLSVAVWVGIIGLLSIDAETGVFMLLYLDLAYEDARRQRRLSSIRDLHDAIVNGAAKRLRPKFMTFATTCIGLMPIMWSIGPGADVMKRIAAPMVGGIFSSFLLELLVYPAIYEIWRGRSVPRSSSQIELNDRRPEPSVMALLAARD